MRQFFLVASLFFLFFIQSVNGQVTLYSAPEYRGLSIKVYEGSISRMGSTLIGNDRLGSMIIPKGYRVTLYEHDQFTGYAETFDASVLNLPDRLKGNVSSIVVDRNSGSGWVSGTATGQPGWNSNAVFIYSECYYGGQSNQMLAANYPTMPANFHRRLSSLRIPAGYEVDIFNQVNFGGRVIRLRADQACVPQEWNNVVASMKVYKTSSGYYPPNNYDPWTQSDIYNPSNSSVTVFDQCNFSGGNLMLADGEYGVLPAAFNRRIFSVRVPQGKEVLLYSGPGLTGPYFRLTADKPCLSNNNEYMIGSIKIQPRNSGGNNPNDGWMGGVPPRPMPTAQPQEEITAFNDCNYRGRTTNYRPGAYPILIIGVSNKISSLRIPRGRRIILYTGANYTGRSYILTRDSDCLTDGFNNNIRSLIVEGY